MDFREQVEEEIKDFSREQIVAFAWRCGVRALPFLGYQGHFDFWKEKDRQKYLYAVLNALDHAAYAAAYAAYAAADAADAAAYAYGAAYAAAAAAAAAYAADAAAAAAAAADDDAADAAYAAARAANIDGKIDIETEVVNDIRAVKGGGAPVLSMKSYGSIWDAFIRALEEEGCGYWADWYTRLFENDFQFDIEEVERRIGLPKEFTDQGAAVVGRYMEQFLKEGGGERLNEARILILGDKGAGKTCVARKLVDPKAKMTTPEESTPGVDTSLWTLSKENMNVRIWDFAGHTVTHAVHQFFLSERCLYLLVYNGRTEETGRLEYWLDHMKTYGGASEAMILVNVRDPHYNEIPINRLKEQYAIKEVYYVNVESDIKELDRFREDVADYIVTNPSWENQQIPKSYYHVKEDLEARFAKKAKGKTEEHISREVFDTIAKKHNIDKPERLLEDLHALGISLWYKGMEKYNTLILNPEWISDGVYQIVNWVHRKKTHEIALTDFPKVFEKEEQRYPKSQYEFLFDLILNYELAYKTAGKKRLIIPHLLNKDQPKELPVFEIGDSLMLKYKADRDLLPHTISRFIVRHHEQIKKQGKQFLVWRYGVILEDGKGNLALVREWDRTIDVSVKGPTKTEYISELRATLNEIFEDYKSAKPELQYNVTRFGDESYIKAYSRLPEHLGKPQENWLPERTILSHLKRGRDYYDADLDRDIPVKNISIEYNIEGDYISAQDIQAFSKGDHTQQFINNFDFKDCNVSLQGNLNELAGQLKKQGGKEEAEDLFEAAKILDNFNEEQEPKEVKKSGLLNGLKRIIEDLGDEESTLYKRVDGVRKSVRIAQDIAAKYNEIAQWVGWPQVPKPFLKKKE